MKMTVYVNYGGNQVAGGSPELEWDLRMLVGPG